MGKIPGEAKGYDTGPVAIVNGRVVGDVNRRHSNHAFYGPGYPIAHPGLFPFNTRALRWSVKEWLTFNYRESWEGGYFGFSTETLPAEVLEGRDFMVGRKQRFAQGEDYLLKTLAEHDFKVLSIEPITVRMEDGEPVPGHMVVARKNA